MMIAGIQFVIGGTQILEFSNLSSAAADNSAEVELLFTLIEPTRDVPALA